MSSFRSRRLRENLQYHRKQVTIMTGSNWRFRNRGGRQDLMLSTYQISSCNTSGSPLVKSLGVPKMNQTNSQTLEELTRLDAAVDELAVTWYASFNQSFLAKLKAAFDASDSAEEKRMFHPAESSLQTKHSLTSIILLQ
jgi:hypothetical protein